MVKQCIAPEEIQAGDLAAYLDGQAPARVIAHIKKCQSCAEEAAAMQVTEALLRAAAFRAECPSADELFEYHVGALAAPQRKQIEHHITQCRDCKRELRELEKAGEMPAPSGPSIAGRVKGAIRQLLIARPVTASLQPAFALLGSDEKRRVEYQAQDYKIILTLAPPLAAKGAWEMEGSVVHCADMPTDYQGKVALLHKGKKPYQDVVDKTGYFALRGVRPGRYTLQIELPATCLLVESFAIPPAKP